MLPTVVFLAPTIRSGSGGVADYCQRLREVLVGEGFACHLASWNEKGGGEDAPDASGMQDLFLGDAASAREKCARLGLYLDRCQAGWISLQFVNFGFARRGIIPGLAAGLRAAVGARRCQIFLHELWVGAHRRAGTREKVLGAVQKRQLLHLLATLRPEALWTSNDFYQRQLAEAGVDAEVVPIFGNFPLTEKRMDAAILRQLKNSPALGDRGKYLLVGLFGSIDCEWPFRTVVPRLQRFAGSRTLAFIFFGRNGDCRALQTYFDSLPRTEWLSLGELSADEVDSVMNSMDLAVATTPAEGISKSGSAVAFLERGLPTVALASNPGMSNAPGTSRPNLVLADDDLERNLARIGSERNRQALLPSVAQRYIQLFRSSARDAAVGSRPPLSP